MYLSILIKTIIIIIIIINRMLNILFNKREEPGNEVDSLSVLLLSSVMNIHVLSHLMYLL